MLGWAESQPRTGDTLNTLQFHLAHLGYVREAVAVQKEAVAASGTAARQRPCQGRGVRALANPGATLPLLIFGPGRWRRPVGGASQQMVSGWCYRRLPSGQRR